MSESSTKPSVTKAQAVSDAQVFHYTGRGECSRTVGPRGGVTTRVVEARRTGRTQVWITRPSEFRVPICHGLRDHGEITDRNATDWHLASECPLLVAQTIGGQS